MTTSTITIQAGRWYRFHKPDGTSIELKTVGSRSFIGRDGSEYSEDVIRELHPSKPVEALESDLDWPSQENPHDRNFKKDEKIPSVAVELPDGFSQEDLVAKFIEMHTKDWDRIQKAQRDHERKKKPEKTHPMPSPEQYLKNCDNTWAKAR